MDLASIIKRALALIGEFPSWPRCFVAHEAGDRNEDIDHARVVALAGLFAERLIKGERTSADQLTWFMDADPPQIVGAGSADVGKIGRAHYAVALNFAWIHFMGWHGHWSRALSPDVRAIVHNWMAWRRSPVEAEQPAYHPLWKIIVSIDSALPSKPTRGSLRSLHLKEPT